MGPDKYNLLCIFRHLHFSSVNISNIVWTTTQINGRCHLGIRTHTGMFTDKYDVAVDALFWVLVEVTEVVDQMLPSTHRWIDGIDSTYVYNYTCKHKHFKYISSFYVFLSKGNEEIQCILLWIFRVVEGTMCFNTVLEAVSVICMLISLCSLCHLI